MASFSQFYHLPGEAFSESTADVAMPVDPLA